MQKHWTGSLLILLGLFLIGCGIFSRKKAPSEQELREARMLEAENHVQDGIAYFQKQKFREAVREWRAALKLIPNDAEVHNYLGIAYHRLGLLDSAIVAHRQAVRLDSLYYQAWNNLGYIYFLKGQYDSALVYFEKAVAINPTYAQAKTNLQKCREILAGKIPLRAFALLQEAEKADSLPLQLKYYRAALSVDSNYTDAWNNLGVTYAYLGEPDSAMDCFYRALKLNPNHVQALNNLGYMLDLSGRYEEAIRFFKRALEVDPGFVTALINLGDAYFHKGDYPSARIAWEGALRLHPDDRWITRRLQKLEAAEKQGTERAGEEP
ncbi:MAG: tetratricopeptide repeat protein [Calditrichaeota bacterium]|nr:MAG: tetratricopeptide repeat protein [Calditrichota bacterium]